MAPRPSDKPPPAVADLLENNNPPLQIDLPSINASISSIETELSNFSEESSSSEEASSSGEEESESESSSSEEEIGTKITAKKHNDRRGVLKAALRRYRAILSPLRRFSSDILKRIFGICVESGFQRSGKPVGPWVLTQICRFWRQCMLDNPKLWSRLQIDGTSSHSQVARRYPLVALQTHILRSGRADLDIDIKFGHMTASDEHWSNLMAFVISTSSRWRTASLSWEDSNPLALQSISVIVGRPPRLRRLELHGNLAIIPPGTGLSSIMRAPNLRHFEISSTGDGPFEYATLPIVWNELETLRIDTKMTIGMALAVLRATPKLRDCSLINVTSSSAPEDDAPPSLIHLTSLTRLHIRSPLGDSVDALIASIDTPNIEYLVVEAPTAPFVALIERSHRQLRGLRVDSAHLPSVLALVTLSPELVHLEVKTREDAGDLAEYPDSEPFLQALTVPPGTSTPVSPALCTKLQTIRVSCASDREVIILAAVIHSRLSESSSTRTLRSVYVDKYLGSSGRWQLMDEERMTRQFEAVFRHPPPPRRALARRSTLGWRPGKPAVGREPKEKKQKSKFPTWIRIPEMKVHELENPRD
ncbi:hypothetical protein C8F01DRAFT_1106154 [Mycena amicta]|nr:hypothetical protein C8F01DRAFT_1106154 [Mycena amicta]